MAEAGNALETDTQLINVSLLIIISRATIFAGDVFASSMTSRRRKELAELQDSLQRRPESD